jgi:predicted DNA-binding transcriptional regulator YafY
MDKFDRIFRLHAVLNGRKSAISARDLQEKLGCSRATLHRDIALFKDYLHAPVEFDPDAGGYRFSTTSGTFELPGLWFSAAELQALVATGRRVQPSCLGGRPATAARRADSPPELTEIVLPL